MANKENKNRLEAKDFPREEVNLGEENLNVDKDPCPPKISIHPPSIFFWRWDPENKGIREVAWALIGVVNARDVKNSLIKGSFINLEE